MSKIDSYVWKDKRLTHNKNEVQIEVKLIDLDEDQLQKIYTHCKDMLYNTDKKNLGRMIVLDQIKTQLSKCRAELALRWFTSQMDENGNPKFTSESLMIELRNWIDGIPNGEEYMLKDLVQVPAEFQLVKIKDLQEACTDTLGSLNHAKITLSFIYKLGLYLTQEELRDIDNDLRNKGLNPDSYTLQQKVENHIKFPLNINAEVSINSRGLTASEFRDMITLKKYKGYRVCKYSSLSTNQLKTLANKVLYFLELRTVAQAKQWKEIMSHIEEVAKYKHYKLN